MKATYENYGVIIPMAGTGSRFKKAGYTDYKPFIKIKNKPMINYVTDAFPKEIKKYIIYSPNLVSEVELNYLKSFSDFVLCPIEEHKNGPVYSVLQAKKQLPETKSYFVSYCDIFWTWDFKKDVEPFLNEDGIVFTRNKFHPHLVKDNFSAFCKSKNDNPLYLDVIQEKKSFTDDWMQEPLSIGCFYFKNYLNMITAFESLLQTNNRVAGEFFPSITFNELIKNKSQIRLINVDFFIHWGLPTQLNDFLYWNELINKLNNNYKNIYPSKISNICCMGGLGARMKVIDSKPKALLNIRNKPMFEFVIKNTIFNSENILLTVDSVFNQIHLLDHGCEIINIGQQTNSQFETLTKAKNILIKKNNFLLSSCDALGLMDYDKLYKIISEKKPDAIIFTFKPTLLQSKLSGHHTYVSELNGKINAVHIKSKSKDQDLGLAGLFWFKHGHVFSEIENTTLDPKNEMCADHFLKHLVEIGKDVLAFPLDQYLHLGTPEEYLEFIFWDHYINSLYSNLN